jgi:hypothetical protein
MLTLVHGSQIPLVGQFDAEQNWLVTLRAAGPVRILMSVDEVRYALDDPDAALVPVSPGSNPPCASLASQALPQSIDLMFQGNRLVRINVHGAGPHTDAAIGVGDTEARVLQQYEGRIDVGLHPYLDADAGRYLMVRNAGCGDHDFGMIFETRDGVVRSFRAGTRQAVNLIGGCG